MGRREYHIFLIQIGFWKRLRWYFQDTENVFNGIVVNKLKTINVTCLSKLFYLLNWGVYFYHKSNSHMSNLKLIIIKKKLKKKSNMSYILLSLSTQKKVIYGFYMLLFVIFFKKKISKIENIYLSFFFGIITDNPPVVWAKITLPTRGLKSVT